MKRMRVKEQMKHANTFTRFTSADATPCDVGGFVSYGDYLLAEKEIVLLKLQNNLLLRVLRERTGENYVFKLMRDE